MDGGPTSDAPGGRHSGDDSAAEASLLDVLWEAADAIAGTLSVLDDWGLAGTRDGQYRSDLAADAAALPILTRAGLGVLSEESGRHDPDAAVTVVVDPLDGSTNASRGIPWFATSLCAVDAAGPAAAVVVNLATGQRFDAVRGGGARLDGLAIHPTDREALGDAIIGLSGFPRRYLGWRQFRALGAAALDLCAVAAGVLDGYVDCSVDAHGSWDYLGGALVCTEAGGGVVDALGRDLVVLDHAARRTPVAAGTPALLAALVDARAAGDASA
jgi:fructose-1,6-bisphosphatase/inositol monophosphatase family enzyme